MESLKAAIFLAIRYAEEVARRDARSDGVAQNVVIFEPGQIEVAAGLLPSIDCRHGRLAFLPEPRLQHLRQVDGSPLCDEKLVLAQNLLDLFGAVDRGRIDLEVIPLQVANTLAWLDLLQWRQEPLVGLAHHAAQGLRRLVVAVAGQLALVDVEVEAPLLYVVDNGLPGQH